MIEPLAPGGVIGILGGGQLGRMLSVAASRLGFRTCIFEPGEDCPASHVAWRHVQRPYDDADALRAFAATVDVITYEFENIPTLALDVLEPLRPVRPGRKALHVSQDRLREKDFLSGLGLRVAPYAEINSLSDLRAALNEIPPPAILKTRRFGYDGKGQARISAAQDADAAWAAIGGAPAILEGYVAFDVEASVIGARGLDGSVACFDPGENVHEGGILRTTTVPSQLSAAEVAEAVLMTGKILNALDYVGVLGVELFITKAGAVVNEIAPRVHNSGHWTQAGCAVDQFEQHVRAISGWPLGDGARHVDVTMQNLIGNEVENALHIAREPGASLHLYGKAEVKPGRKMGHVNRIRALGGAGDA